MTTAVQSNPLAEDLERVFAHTAPSWECLRGQTVLITGGTGFFGRWLLESFADANRRLNLQATAVALARHPEAFRQKAAGLCADPAIRLVQGDVRHLEAADLRAQLGASASRGISHVIHAASETSVPANRDNPRAVIDTLVGGTQRVLDLAAQSGVQHFLLISSGAVYGEQPGAVSHVSESFRGAPDVASPLSAYGEGKRVAELLCHAGARTAGFNGKVARCFAFVGPHLALDAHYAIGNFIRDALNGGTLQIRGDGTPLRSYLYAADLAAWLWTILLRPAATGTYNVGSDRALAIGEVAEIVAGLAAIRPRIVIAQSPDRSRPVQRYVPEINRARRELGLEVWTPLDEAVRKTLEFHQSNQKTCP